jgi:predicted neutral ceramidase superfamily lipid hydrolase
LTMLDVICLSHLLTHMYSMQVRHTNVLFLKITANLEIERYHMQTSICKMMHECKKSHELACVCMCVCVHVCVCVCVCVCV